MVHGPNVSEPNTIAAVPYDQPKEGETGGFLHLLAAKASSSFPAKSLPLSTPFLLPIIHKNLETYAELIGHHAVSGTVVGWGQLDIDSSACLQ